MRVAIEVTSPARWARGRAMAAATVVRDLRDRAADTEASGLRQRVHVLADTVEAQARRLDAVRAERTALADANDRLEWAISRQEVRALDVSDAGLLRRAQAAELRAAEAEAKLHAYRNERNLEVRVLRDEVTDLREQLVNLGELDGYEQQAEAEATVVQCQVCGRRSYGDTTGSVCKMPQPGGSVCPGIFKLARTFNP